MKYNLIIALSILFLQINAQEYYKVDGTKKIYTFYSNHTSLTENINDSLVGRLKKTDGKKIEIILYRKQKKSLTAFSHMQKQKIKG